jgi:hypothetical protein
MSVDHSESVAVSLLKIDFNESIKQRTKSTMSSLKFDRIKPIKISIVHEGQRQQIDIPLKNMKKKCAEYAKEESELKIYSVELGSYKEGLVKEGPIIEYAIVSANQIDPSVIAFVGEYNANKKSKGIYLLIRKDEAFMFKGVFNDAERSGMKATLGSGGY